MKQLEHNAFAEMEKAAVARLAGRRWQQIAEKANVKFDSRVPCFRVPSLGREVAVAYPSFRIGPEVGQWQKLVILHYLDLADGTPLSSGEISFGQLKGGLARGVNFDRQAEAALRAFGRRPEGELREVCRRLGATFPPSNADLCAVFPFLPNYPITLKLWFPDEEFGASGRLLLNASAEHYLTIEDAVTAGSILLSAFSAGPGAPGHGEQLCP